MDVKKLSVAKYLPRILSGTKDVMSGNIELFVFLNKSIVNILSTAIIINRYKLKPIISV